VGVSSRRTPAIDRLRSLALLQAATEKELDRIDRLTCEVAVPAGKVMTREGARPQGFALILSGSAIVTIASLECIVLQPGMFFGETAVLDGGPEPFTVTALTPMLLRVATAEELVQLSEVGPLTRAILPRLATRQRLALRIGSQLTSADLADSTFAPSSPDDEAKVESACGATPAA
jgi:CRP-like cAMP-binding protein